MINKNDYYAKLHIMSKRKVGANLKHVISTQRRRTHNRDGHVLKIKIKKVSPYETLNPSFFKFDIQLPTSFIQNNHGKIIYGISIWDAKTNKMIKTANFKAPKFYEISKHKPVIIFSVPVEF